LIFSFIDDLSLLEEYFLSHCLLPQLFQFYKEEVNPTLDTSTIGPWFENLIGSE